MSTYLTYLSLCHNTRPCVALLCVACLTLAFALHCRVVPLPSPSLCIILHCLVVILLLFFDPKAGGGAREASGRISEVMKKTVLICMFACVL